MATNVDINGFHKDEYVEIQFFGRDRLGAALTDAASHEVKFSLSATDSGSPLPGMEWTTNSSHISLIDAPNAQWEIALTPADLSEVVEKQIYYFNLWSQRTVNTPILQAKGRFVLMKSIKPS